MELVLLIVVAALLCYCIFTVAYYYFLAGAYFLIRDEKKPICYKYHSFCILIPAHNEEILLGKCLESINEIEYPKDKYKIVVIADNCNDNTAMIAMVKGAICLERSMPDLMGKGHALGWALKQIDIDAYHAILIIDADNIVDPQILMELDCSVSSGSRIIQCHNAIGNPDASWFTRIQHIVRVIDNTFVHCAKHKLGWSSFLMGNGMCFVKDILKKHPWRSVSLCEDFEYYTQLILNDEFIDFNYNAKVFHQESTSLGQAYTQRSRWSSGKFELMRTHALRMLCHGIRKRNLKSVEASFILLLPHPSMLCNLSVVAFMISMVLPRIWVILSTILILLEMGYLVLGMFQARASARTVLSFLFAPIFLVWKALIDLVNMFGLGEKEWRRTAR